MRIVTRNYMRSSMACLCHQLCNTISRVPYGVRSFRTINTTICSQSDLKRANVTSGAPIFVFKYRSNLAKRFEHSWARVIYRFDLNAEAYVCTLVRLSHSDQSYYIHENYE